MMRLLTALVVMMHLAVFSQETEVNAVRSLFFSMDKDQTAALAINKLMNEKQLHVIPVLVAYRGALSAFSAAKARGAYNKYRCFNSGKADIERAVRLDPADPEIRFLRLAIQTNAPGFLFYSGNIIEDKRIVLKGLAGMFEKETERVVARNIAKNLLAFNSLTAREKQIVNQLSFRYEQNN